MTSLGETVHVACYSAAGHRQLAGEFGHLLSLTFVTLFWAGTTNQFMLWLCTKLNRILLHYLRTEVVQTWHVTASGVWLG